MMGRRYECNGEGRGRGGVEDGRVHRVVCMFTRAVHCGKVKKSSRVLVGIDNMLRTHASSSGSLFSVCKIL